MARTKEVAEDLRNRLRAGEFPIGSPFLVISEVQWQYDAAFHTALKALRRLHVEGLIEITQGKRSIVLAVPPPNPADLLATLRNAQRALAIAIAVLEPKAG